MPHVTAADGVSIYYETHGSGPPTLLLQGAFGTLDAWHRTGNVEALSSDRRVILLDLRGHGRSDKPHDAALYGFDRNASDVLAVLEAAHADDVDVFGQSMGGQVVIAMLSADTSRIRSFATNGSAPLPEPLDRPLGFLLRRAKRLREEGIQSAIQDAMTRRLPGEEANNYLEIALDSDVEAYIAEAEGSRPCSTSACRPQARRHCSSRANTTPSP